MLNQYLPVFVFLLVGLGIGLALLFIGKFAGKHFPNRAKESAYECGFDAFEDARIPFDVRFYLVAILFILFDLETAFFFPWAATLRDIGMPGFISMMVFLSLLVVGFIYEWRKGALEWE